MTRADPRWRGAHGTAESFGFPEPKEGRFTEVTGGRYAARCNRHERFFRTNNRREARLMAQDTRLWCNACRTEAGLSMLPGRRSGGPEGGA